MSSNPIYALFATPKSFGPLILRMMLTVIFLFHGGQKVFGLFDGDGWSGTLKSFSGEGGMGFPTMVTVIVMLTEISIPVAMFFGFLTRLAACGVIGVMTGAIYYVHAGQGWAACEFPFSLLMAGLALLFLGGGRLSLDRAISGQILPTLGGY